MAAGGRVVLRVSSRRRLTVSLAIVAAPAAAQDGKPDQDIVITGERIAGSAIGEVKPLAVLDEAAIRALGATTMEQLLQRLKPLTAAGGGAGEPIFLLNGRRIAGFQELNDLPPEAMERTEVLPREEAVRFGYPPTATVVNFITKKRFRALTLQQMAGTSTDGGGSTNYAETSSTQLDGDRRTTLSVTHFRQNPVVQASRGIVPDPDFLFATGGNVAAADGGSIDARLDALAGRPVTVAALPDDPAARATLAGYLAGAGRPAVTDPGATRWLVGRSDRIKVSGTMAAPVAPAITGSLNLSMEALRNSGRNGPAPALLRVPGGAGALPFADDTLVYRYLPDAVLRQRNTNMSLHAGGSLNGSIARWTWTVTGSHDRVQADGRSEQGVVLDRLQAAIDAGADPLTPPDAQTLASRRLVRSDTLTRTTTTKATANGPIAKLPAGNAQLTVAADYAQSASSGMQPGVAGSRFALDRTIRGASVSAALPIADRDRGVLGAIGQMGATATLAVSDVSGFGRLVATNSLIHWTPRRPVQVMLSLDTAQTAPDIAQLTSPVLTTPNTPFFDFTTGTSVLVTAISGGNPALAPERRQTATIGIAVTPIPRRDLRFGIDYVETQRRDQALNLGGMTPALQAAFPGAFGRDASGRLVSVDFRPLNVARERDRLLRLTANLATPLGPKPPEPTPAAGAPADSAPPPAPPKQRPFLFTSLTGTIRLADRLFLAPGVAPLDLLDGATLTGTGGRPRWEVDGNINLNIGPVSTGLYAQIQGPTRVRSEIAAADLRFSGRTNIMLWQSFDVAKMLSRPWTRSLSLQLSADNLLNDRINVRDRNGDVPNRFQPAYLDPVGRTVRLGVRKLF